MAVRGNSMAAENYTEPDWATAVPKEPSEQQLAMDAWLRDKAQEEIEAAFKGIDLDNAKQSKAFLAGVVMCFRFRMKFQASPENQAAGVEAAANAAKAKKASTKKAAVVDDDDEDEAPAPKKAKAKKGAKAKPVVVDDDDDDEDEAPAPKAKAKSATSKGKRGGKAAF